MEKLFSLLIFAPESGDIDPELTKNHENLTAYSFVPDYRDFTRRARNRFNGLKFAQYKLLHIVNSNNSIP